MRILASLVLLLPLALAPPILAQEAVPRAEQAVLVAEAGFNWFHSLPNDVRFNGPALHLPATVFGTFAGNPPALSLQTDGFLTDFSWGYRVAGRLEYNNLLFGGNVSPRLAYSDDVREETRKAAAAIAQQMAGYMAAYQVPAGSAAA